MWKEYSGTITNSKQLLSALNSLNALAIRASNIKIVNFGEINKIFYYENDY